MCGITGAVWSDPQKEISLPVLEQMTQVLRHRGPDDAGHYTSDLKHRAPYDTAPGVALGFRRLSIIDLAGGHQPLSNEDGTIWIVFNGEVYNFADLRRRLEGAGHQFKTDSDTECIVHLYEDEGPACFEHLSGMFAIAIWDSRQRRLVLGRDRLGKKPLVYRQDAGRLLFASELKSLLQVPGLPREVDPAAVDEYLTYQYVPHPGTIFKGFRKLPPGYCAVWQDGKLQVRPYWQPDFAQQQSIRQEDASQQLETLLENAVKMRMRSDVPLGAFLSGGIDSSLIAALMQRNSTQKIKTFSLGFSVKEYDETKYARQVAAHLGTEHYEETITPEALKILPQLAYHYDEPFGDSSAIPTWYVSEMTRKHVTVALSGDGGDELFAGYSRYRAVRLAARLDQVPLLRGLAASRVWQWLPSSSRQKSKLRQLKRFCQALTQQPAARYLNWIGIFSEERRANLYHDDFVKTLPESDPADFLGQAWSRAGKRDSTTAATVADILTYLPCDLLNKVDIASMAHSLECRQPFLDHHLVEFAATLPLSLKLRGGRGKYLLQQTFGNLLPANIWTRPKMGFGVPLDYWFRGELRPLLEETLLGNSAHSHAFFRPEALRALADEHFRGTFDHSARLWLLLMLEMWLKTWLHGH